MFRGGRDGLVFEEQDARREFCKVVEWYYAQILLIQTRTLPSSQFAKIEAAEEQGFKGCTNDVVDS